MVEIGNILNLKKNKKGEFINKTGKIIKKEEIENLINENGDKIFIKKEEKEKFIEDYFSNKKILKNQEIDLIDKNGKLGDLNKIRFFDKKENLLEKDEIRDENGIILISEEINVNIENKNSFLNISKTNLKKTIKLIINKFKINKEYTNNDENFKINDQQKIEFENLDKNKTQNNKKNEKIETEEKDENQKIPDFKNNSILSKIQNSKSIDQSENFDKNSNFNILESFQAPEKTEKLKKNDIEKFFGKSIKNEEDFCKKGNVFKNSKIEQNSIPKKKKFHNSQKLVKDVDNKSLNSENFRKTQMSENSIFFENPNFLQSNRNLEISYKKLIKDINFINSDNFERKKNEKFIDNFFKPILSSFCNVLDFDEKMENFEFRRIGNLFPNKQKKFQNENIHFLENNPCNKYFLTIFLSLEKFGEKLVEFCILDYNENKGKILFRNFKKKQVFFFG